MEINSSASEQIGYRNADHAWDGYQAYILGLISESGAKRILEVGGGANPLLPLNLTNQLNLHYCLLDISQHELEKAPDGYFKLCGDIGADNFSSDEKYDLVFSKMLAEHIKDGEKFHRNILDLLLPGGMAVHYFPTLYAPPFVINRTLPESVADWLLHLLQPGRETSGRQGKFPAYYSWCFGPTRQQIKRFENIGYRVERYIGYFGHDAYYQKLPLFKAIHRKISAWLVEHPIPALTSFAYVVLIKR